NGRGRIRTVRWLFAGSRNRLWHCVHAGGNVSRACVHGHSGGDSCLSTCGCRAPLEISRSAMKIKEIRTRVFRWRGKTAPLPPHFCTNPMDLLQLPQASMGTFTFHGWLVVEVFSDDGLAGIGNAALAPQLARQAVDLYLKPLLIGQNPWDVEFLWQHMYRKTMAFGRKGIGMAAISAVDIALWDLLGKAAKQPVFRLVGGRTKPRIPVYASRLYA